MFSIDFSLLPDISNKLNTNEINSLNTLFRAPEVQGKIEEIEIHRKKRHKWKFGIIFGSITVSVILALILGKGDILQGILYKIGSEDDSIYPVFVTFTVLCIGGLYALYNKFASKIETPLKRDILSRMCPMLYSKLQYSHDAQYSFDELDVLKNKGLLKSYTDLDIVEDSIYFDVEKDNKRFTVHGFELQTSQVTGTGKRRRTVITNHCYLMRVHFPNARIPLQNDILIQKDSLDTLGSTNLIVPIVATILSIAVIAIGLENFFLGILIGMGIGLSIFFVQKIGFKKHRIELENTDFEKMFDVKCQDAVSSRMIITPAFMDRVVQLTKKTGNKYEFLIQNNLMYIKRIINDKYLDINTNSDITKNLGGFIQFYIDMREIIEFIVGMNLIYLSQTSSGKTQNITEEMKTVTPLIFKSGLHTNGLFKPVTNLLSQFGSSGKRTLW